MVPIRHKFQAPLPTAADEADVMIGARGVLGGLNATPLPPNTSGWILSRNAKDESRAFTTTAATDVRLGDLTPWSAPYA
jgi:hypothetical protein